MFQRIKQWYSGPQASVRVLVTSAIAVVLFMLIAGGMVYTNTQNLIKASDWVQHTQDVLLSLQRALRLVERVEYQSHSFLEGSGDSDLRTARSNADLLRTAAVHLQVLVQDNPGQTNYSQQLVDSANDLQKTVSEMHQGSPMPITQLQQCQQAIGLMNELEQRLLKERSASSQNSSYRSIATEVGFVVLALLALLISFGFLLRDALLKGRIGLQMKEANDRLANGVAALEERAHEAEELTVCRDELQLCLDIDQVYTSTTRSAARLLPDTSGCLCMINSSRNLVEVVSRWGDTHVEDFAPPESCCGLRSGYPRWREPRGSEIHCTHFEGGVAPERYLCLPIVAHGNGLGMLYVQCGSSETVEQVKSRLDGVRQFVQLMGMTVAAMNLRQKLENQSIRDSLTGLFNRHFMQIALERELSRAARRGDTLAVFMLDVDHFKRFNDTHGHAAGDTVLKAIAEVYRNSTRAEDVVCRYGGEEFTIILPDITAEGAFDRAERIRQDVERLRVLLSHDVSSEVTISIGVAIYPIDGRDGDELLRHADNALYRAKRQGRNQVSMAEIAATV